MELLGGGADVGLYDDEMDVDDHGDDDHDDHDGDDGDAEDAVLITGGGEGGVVEYVDVLAVPLTAS